MTGAEKVRLDPSLRARAAASKPETALRLVALLRTPTDDLGAWSHDRIIAAYEAVTEELDDRLERAGGRRLSDPRVLGSVVLEVPAGAIAELSSWGDLLAVVSEDARISPRWRRTH